MEVIWRKSPVTSAAIVAALEKEQGWAANTVRTMLARLVKKGVLKFGEEGNRYLYRPAIPRDRCVKSEVDTLMQRVFGGATSPMLLHFIKNKKLSAAEIRELRQLLDEKESA
jgi:BlaI family transcriptional regulator, penicillinase repressor